MIGFTYRLQVDPDAGAPREYEHILVKNQQGDGEKVIWTVKTQSYGNRDYWKQEYDISDILTKRKPLKHR